MYMTMQRSPKHCSPVGTVGCWCDNLVFNKNVEFIYSATVVLKCEVWRCV